MKLDSPLAEAVSQCQEDQVRELVKQKLDAGVPATEIVTELNRGMVELGNRFGREECFLPDLMFGGMIIKGVMAQLSPKREGPVAVKSVGTAVIGTVQYDVHDIGKDILVTMLRGVGVHVIDLGVDVSPAQFVEAVREHGPAVMGMSLLLTTCFKSVSATVQAVKAAGLRDGLSIMVGGAAAGNLLSANAGCDYYGKTAVDGMKHACQVIGV